MEDHNTKSEYLYNVADCLPRAAREQKYDNVNRPEHYQTKNGLETIDAIEAFTEDLTGIEAVCTGNIIKYVSRWKKKNGIEDLKKAEWYLQRLIRHEEIEESKNKTKENR